MYPLTIAISSVKLSIGVERNACFTSTVMDIDSRPFSISNLKVAVAKTLIFFVPLGSTISSINPGEYSRQGESDFVFHFTVISHPRTVSEGSTSKTSVLCG